MSEVFYLGTTKPTKTVQKHVPGTLVLTKDIDQYSEGEFDLLLARQRIEIEKANSAAVAGPFNYQQDKYDEALKVVNTALNNINNPDVIDGIGDVLVGKAKKKGGKTKAGKFLKKVATGLKKGAKAITKVVTAPLRLLAKGAIEIYLPKAAGAFLYLFADEKTLTDKMRAKRRKQEKFKNFVVKKLGMKEKHFMAIIRNKLTKQYGKSPESFLADGLKKVAVSGIGGDKDKKKKAVNKRKKVVKNTTAKMRPSGHATDSTMRPAHSSNSRPRQFLQSASNAAENVSTAVDTAQNVVNNLTSGNVVGAIMAAIQWLISKLGGKGEGVDLTADDLPDLMADSGNAFDYGDLKQNYNNLNDYQRTEVKDVATDLIEAGVSPSTAMNTIKSKLPYLNDDQVQEIADEVEEGFEPLSQSAAAKLARQIKTGDSTSDDILKLEKTGGGTGTGACSC